MGIENEEQYQATRIKVNRLRRSLEQKDEMTDQWKISPLVAEMHKSETRSLIADLEKDLREYEDRKRSKE